jgi:starch synthase (maltosyl-transferring)
MATAAAEMLPEAPLRVVVSGLAPNTSDGRAIKRCIGDRLGVEVDLVCDGHDRVAGVLRIRPPDGAAPSEVALEARGNDRYAATIPLTAIGTWEIVVEAWVDELGTWLAGLEKKAAVPDVAPVDLAVGASLLRRAGGAERGALADALEDAGRAVEERVGLVLGPEARALARPGDDRRGATRTAPLKVRVDPAHARFAAWYELFPRSTGPGRTHGTFRTTAERLAYVADMGFDVVYLPPVHPIGRTHRKGPNNTLTAGADDPGSPWAIGGPEGGHTAVHPELGTLDDFEALVAEARRLGLRVALDVAFQASPDHPWVKEHPSWFRQRPDGTVQYAENPPKKYQDVYPFDFESEDWRSLWAALRDVFRFWIDRGVTDFRVDNPHTKPVRFWEWCIAELQAEHPEVCFLSEAFTRPSLKYLLGRVGFTQGYTYFTWRTSPAEMRAYVEELQRPEVADVFRPSFWPNTPDILPEDLQVGGRPAFLARLVMAATLSTHYGIYGPAFELLERTPRPGSGEYLDNEKFEIKDWDLDDPASLAPWIKRLNAIRREHHALTTRAVTFHDTDNERLLCFSKSAGQDTVLVVVSFDPHHAQAGWTSLKLDALGVASDHPFQVHDLLGGGRYLWHGARNYVELSPAVLPVQIFALRRFARTERDFDYYL